MPDVSVRRAGSLCQVGGCRSVWGRCEGCCGVDEQDVPDLKDACQNGPHSSCRQTDSAVESGDAGHVHPPQ
jgi:hypothetical protein